MVLVIILVNKSLLPIKNCVYLNTVLVIVYPPPQISLFAVNYVAQRHREATFMGNFLPRRDVQRNEWKHYFAVSGQTMRARGTKPRPAGNRK